MHEKERETQATKLPLKENDKANPSADGCKVNHEKAIGPKANSLMGVDFHFI